MIANMIANMTANILRGLTILFAATLVTEASDVVPNSSDCERALLPSHVRVSPSGRDQDVIPGYKERLCKQCGPGGILEQLGLSDGPHFLDFVSSTDMTELIANGGPAAPHWLPGARIVAGRSSRSSGVYEFVTPGKPNHSFYRDLTVPQQQNAIIDHVIGHNDFFRYSRYFKDRDLNEIPDSMELFDFMRGLYTSENRDQVSHFYQLLMSVVGLQDLTTGLFESPEKFNTQKRRQAGKSQPSLANPQVPTLNILQFLVENLPHGSASESASWKRELLMRVEKTHRHYGAGYKTKIMNEGWASILMEIIGYHTGWTGDTEVFLVNYLLGGVAGVRSFSNPYWLGREAWRCLRRRFFDREDIKDLSAIVKDRKFIEYAHTIIDMYDDYAFLRLALDEKWVIDQNLFLYRKALWHERDWALPPPQDPRLTEQGIVVTRNHERIISSIARETADRRLQVPRIFIDDTEGLGRGVVMLRHDVIDDIPLVLPEAAQALFAMAQIFNRSVSLKTLSVSISEPDNPVFYPFMSWHFPSAAPIKQPVRIEVDALGNIKVYFIKENNDKHEIEEEDNGTLKNKLQAAVDFYKLDLGLSLDDDLLQQMNDRLSAVIGRVVDHNIRALSFSKSPTGPFAVTEYNRVLKARLLKSIELAKSGKLPIRITRKGVRLRVLPLVPEFKLDLEMRETLVQGLEPTPVDDVERGTKNQCSLKVQISPNGAARVLIIDSQGTSRLHTQLTQDLQSKLNLILFNEDFKLTGNDLDRFIKSIEDGLNARFGQAAMISAAENKSGDDLGVGVGNNRPGKRIWIPGKNNKGKKDPGDPGDPGDPDDPSAGDEPRDPSEVEIPFAEWLELLDLELPRLRPKNGQSPLKTDVKEGITHFPDGEVLWSEMIPDLYVQGQISAQESAKENEKKAAKTGKPKRKFILPGQAVWEGFRALTPDQLIVVGDDIKREPDINAIVVVCMDMSGSMMGWPVETAKKFIFMLETQLKKKYKNVSFMFVAFDTKAYEFTDSKKFYHTALGGGTAYAAGFQKSKEILNRYPPGQWDRYLVAIGDSEDGVPEQSQAAFSELLPLTEYAAYIHVNSYFGFYMPGASFFGRLSQFMRGLSESEPYMGYAEFTRQEGSEIDALLKLFGKNREKK